MILMGMREVVSNEIISSTEASFSDQVKESTQTRLMLRDLCDKYPSIEGLDFLYTDGQEITVTEYAS